MPDVPTGRVVHRTHHRLRIKVPAKRRDKSYFTNARQRLSRVPTVDAVEVNPLTASILIRSSDPGSVLEALALEGPFTIGGLESEGEPAQLLDQVRQQLAEWDQMVQEWTGSRHDSRAYIFMALVLGAGFQLLRGDIFAPASTLLWYAGEALRVWSSDEKADAETSPAAREADAP